MQGKSKKLSLGLREVIPEMKKSAKRFPAILAFLLAIVFCCPTAFAAVGDVNGNGRLQAADARLVLRYSARLETLSNAILSRADVNYDEKVNAADARLLLKASSRAISLEYFYQYGMTAVYTDPATGRSSTLETAWQSGKLYLRIDAARALVYDSGADTVALIDDAARRFSELLPTPLALEDQGFIKSAERGNTVYYKAYPNGYQRYTFDLSHLPTKCEYYYNGALQALEIRSFSADPTALFTEYLSYTKS